MEKLALLSVEPAGNIEPRWKESVQPHLDNLVLRAGRGRRTKVLFNGPEGSGKTVAVKWVASRLNATVHVLDSLDEFFDAASTVKHALMTNKVARMLDEPSEDILIVCTRQKELLHPALIARLHFVIEF